jgi:hypothetical protein
MRIPESMSMGDLVSDRAPVVVAMVKEEDEEIL